MDISYDLLSTMSPKLDKFYKPLRKAPTKLSLNKYFRRSLNSKPHNCSYVSVISVSSSGSSTSEEILNKTPIVISDSESSLIINDLKTDELSPAKLAIIQKWVNNVNQQKNELSLFSELSSISSDSLKSSQCAAFSSTVLIENGPTFDKFFKKSDNAKKTLDKSGGDSCGELVPENCNTLNEVIEDSLENLENSLCSSDMNSKRDSHTKSNLEAEKQNEPPPSSNVEELETLLDTLYGNSWRRNKDSVLPSTEPRGRKEISSNKAVPKTEKIKSKPKNNNRIFQKPSESPWVRSLKHICDSDTDSDDIISNNRISPIKINFDDEDDDVEDKVVPKRKNNYVKKQLNHINSHNRQYFSFLASLSGATPLEKCDITARIFREDFKKNRDNLTKKLFNLFNEKVFENKLPQDTVIEWSIHLRGTAGICSCKKLTKKGLTIGRVASIKLATKVLDSADRLRDTLIHEMCHAATWIINNVSDGHGAFWKAWAHKAMKTFPELPPIKTCHNYIINTKYTYKCTKCGYSIGRHSKSLNIHEKRCGKCLGTFELLINKSSKSGEVRTVPATPKKQPTGFALFVKENYADFKSPTLKHKDVMQILGKEFSNLKVNKA